MVVEVVVVVVLVLFGVGGVSGDGGGWSDSGFDGGISTQMIRLAFDDRLRHGPTPPPISTPSLSFCQLVGNIFVGTLLS